MPRRLGKDPELADDEIRLEPLNEAHVAPIAVVIGDPDIVRFTRVPSGADDTFVRGWIARYVAGWGDGSCAGFAIRATDGEIIGFAALVDLDLDHREGEIGYMVAPAARGRGVARRAVELLTRWGFDELGLVRLELRIDVENPGSVAVARRTGYRLDGVLRQGHVKEGLRADVGVWSRLSND